MSKTIQFNVYTNIRTPQVSNYMTIDEWFNQIKTSKFSSLITAARAFEDGDDIYKGNKAMLPAITYNFKFHTHKNNENITEATGLLYIDVDDLSYDINQLDTSKVYAYYKSYGGKGYSILVQVQGLTLSNYGATYCAVCDSLGLSNFYDTGAKKATQFNVLSFDPDLFHNPDSIIFDAVEPALDETQVRNDIKANTTVKNSDMINIMGKFQNSYGLRYSNINDMVEFKNHENWITDWKGIPVIECWLPMNKIAKNRNNFLTAYCTNLVWLNPHLTIPGTIKIMNSVSKYILVKPADAAHIKRAVTSVFNYKQDGTLKPIPNRKRRKIVFNENGTMKSREEKMVVVYREQSKNYDDMARQKINNIIENWDFDRNGKITQNKIWQIGKMGDKPVKRHWREFKDLVAELNQPYLKSNSNVQSAKPSKIESKEYVYRDIKILISNYEPFEAAVKHLTNSDKAKVINQFTNATIGLNEAVAGDIKIQYDYAGLHKGKHWVTYQSVSAIKVDVKEMGENLVEIVIDKVNVFIYQFRLICPDFNQLSPAKQLEVINSFASAKYGEMLLNINSKHFKVEKIKTEDNGILLDCLCQMVI